MTTKDRRKHPRANLNVAVDVHSGSNFYSAETKDISEGGLFIESRTFLPLGETVQVHLGLHGKKFELSAEVAWILEDEDGSSVGFGARFLNLNRAARAAIRSFMESRTPMPFLLLADEPDDLIPAVVPSERPRRVCPPPLPVAAPDT